MRVEISAEAVEVRLSLWEKVLGLMGNIRVSRADISDVRVVDNPMRETMRSGTLKVGLRLPWLIYVARSISLDQAFIVRRGAPGLAFAVANRRLRGVLLSTPRAAELAEQLRGGA